jgi:hypothetical protein
MNRGRFRQIDLNWCALVAIAVSSFASTCSAQMRSHAEQQLAHRLDARISLTWQGQQVASGLERLAGAQDITMWIDRRVDPTTPIDLTVSDQSLREALAIIGNSHAWAATPYHGVLYFGPQQTAAELATLSALARQELAGVSAERRSRWLKAEPWSVARLSQPRELLGELARSAGARVIDDQLVPHDLLPGRSLPAISVLDRVVLLLASFDLACDISADGGQLRVVPMERPVHVTRSYTISRARSPAVEAILNELPLAKVERTGPRITLSARLEDHERLQSAIRGESGEPVARPARQQPSATHGPQRFTLKIENQPVGRVIDQLAQQLQLEVAWDAELEKNPAAGRDARVSCEVREADLDGLLAAVLKPAGLAFDRDGRTVAIRRED